MPAHRDPDVLRELYVERGLSTHAVADELDCSQSTVCRWLDHHGIEARDRVEAVRAASTVDYAGFGLDAKGYEVWQDNATGGGTSPDVVKVHRLAAVAWFGLDAVVGKDVHHVDAVKWHTAEGNLELLDHAEHARRHAPERVGARDDP